MTILTTLFYCMLCSNTPHVFITRERCIILRGLRDLHGVSLKTTRLVYVFIQVLRYINLLRAMCTM